MARPTRAGDAFSNRYPQNAATVGGAAFDGWVGSGRVVEPGTVTTDTWTYICMPAGLPSELYNLEDDPAQEHNVIDDHPEVAAELKQAWLDFLTEHGATERSAQRLYDGPGARSGHHRARVLYAFRDDMDQWIAYPTEEEARAVAYRRRRARARARGCGVTFSECSRTTPRTSSTSTSSTTGPRISPSECLVKLGTHLVEECLRERGTLQVE